MDKNKNKALFRAKLNAQKKDKRIESPLVRYNELDHPVCKVCDVDFKSESLWDAHQASRKHHEAISQLKANAAGQTRKISANSVSQAKSEASVVLPSRKPESSKDLPTSHSSSVLPQDFFDNNKAKQQKSIKSAEQDLSKRSGGSTQIEASSKQTGGLHSHSAAGLESSHAKASVEDVQTSEQATQTGPKQVKGVLPAGFFDNKEADLRARGIKLIKPDIKDEYKEYEKLIQEDLQEVDNRLEEDEIDAAEMIKEEESIEQESYREKVEMLKRKRMEMKAAKSAKRAKPLEVANNDCSPKESSSDDDSEENFAVDWRAQHL